MQKRSFLNAWPDEDIRGLPRGSIAAKGSVETFEFLPTLFVMISATAKKYI